MSKTIFWFALFCNLIVDFPKNSTCFMKMTNVECINLNKPLLRINECRLRAVKRDLTVLNSNITILQPINNVMLNFAVFKRFNGYKPFLMNWTVEACELLAKKNHPFGNLVIKMLRENSNINHTCPYEGDILLKNFYTRQEQFGLSIPMGDYKGHFNFWVNSHKIFEFNIFVAVTEN